MSCPGADLQRVRYGRTAHVVNGRVTGQNCRKHRLLHLGPTMQHGQVYLVVKLHDFTINIGMIVDLSTVTYNKFSIFGAGIAGGVHFGCMLVPATAYTFSRPRVEVQTWECFRTRATS